MSEVVALIIRFRVNGSGSSCRLFWCVFLEFYVIVKEKFLVGTHIFHDIIRLLNLYLILSSHAKMSLLIDGV